MKFEKVTDYVHEDYIQHNPGLPNGLAALAAFVAGFYAEKSPEGAFAIARLMAYEDIVVAHSLFRLNAADCGSADVDVYRVRDGKLVEYWEVKERVPENLVSGNPMV